MNDSGEFFLQISCGFSSWYIHTYLVASSIFDRKWYIYVQYYGIFCVSIINIVIKVKISVLTHVPPVGGLLSGHLWLLSIDVYGGLNTLHTSCGRCPVMFSVIWPHGIVCIGDFSNGKTWQFNEFAQKPVICSSSAELLWSRECEYIYWLLCGPVV